jgi:hypothetical protein
MLMMSLIISAQTPRSEEDPRNHAPTVGTGGSVGGPTGLFTVYDGQTLRRGEYTFSIAYSNFDRDPGNVDITEVPISFQVGLNDYIECFSTRTLGAVLKLTRRELVELLFTEFSISIAKSKRHVYESKRAGNHFSSRNGNRCHFQTAGRSTVSFVSVIGGTIGSFGFVGRPGVGGIFGFPVNVRPPSARFAPAEAARIYSRDSALRSAVFCRASFCKPLT